MFDLPVLTILEQTNYQKYQEVYVRSKRNMGWYGRIQFCWSIVASDPVKILFVIWIVSSYWNSGLL